MGPAEDSRIDIEKRASERCNVLLNDGRDM